MSRITKFKKGLAASAVVAGGAVLSSPAFAFVDGAIAEVEKAKAGLNSMAPTIIAVVATIVAVTVILSLLRKA